MYTPRDLDRKAANRHRTTPQAQNTEREREIARKPVHNLHDAHVRILQENVYTPTNKSLHANRASQPNRLSHMLRKLCSLPWLINEIYSKRKQNTHTNTPASSSHRSFVPAGFCRRFFDYCVCVSTRYISWQTRN